MSENTETTPPQDRASTRDQAQIQGQSPTLPETDADKTWSRRASIITLCFFFLVVPCGIYLGIYAATRGFEGSDLANRVAFTTIDDREVMIVAYTSDGPDGILDLPHHFREPRRERAMAIDTHTHEILWDTMVVDYYAVRHPGVLAADPHYAYVVTERGLAILETATGEIHSAVDDVDGLGPKRVKQVHAYDYDQQTNAVVALTDDDSVVAIPVGSDSAAPASAEVTERWLEPLKDDKRDWADHEAPGLADGIDSPSGVHVQLVADLPYDGLMFHDQPSDGGCYDEVCYDEADGMKLTIERPGFWSW